MGKYEPLLQFLRRQKLNEVRLTFDQIERIIGGKLPPKAQHHRAWWSNSPLNNVMTKAWLDAGYRSEQVDMEGRKLVFRRTSEAVFDDRTIEKSPNGSPQDHPVFEWMKGTAHIPEGVDLTEPADPEWGEKTWGEKTWSRGG
jgi:hypothetical protein